MNYTHSQITSFMKIFSTLESEAKSFLFISSYPMKHNKDQKLKSAQTTLKAIENYKTLPMEIRQELEKDKTLNVANLTQLEILCKKSIQF